ncbi:unnamed protein product [Sphenostylis stenocarpa]|uniref:Pentatricopeptide repeat-containing protein n=1 Tax=Sphenostylis stenocarpa TaxID=92480 RepID=A0AA86VR34_9FABA|nr:unnamed protein product [Sphenostylis stenocarpa]
MSSGSPTVPKTQMCTFTHHSLIDGFVSFGSYANAVNLFGQMVRGRVSADSYAVTAVLKACVLQRALRSGREPLSEHGMLEFGHLNAKAKTSSAWHYNSKSGCVPT